MLRQLARTRRTLPVRCPRIASLFFVPLAFGCSEMATGPSPESANERLAPPLEGGAAAFDRPFFHGAFLGESESRLDRIDAGLSEITHLVGKRPALVKTFHTLGDMERRFPSKPIIIGEYATEEMAGYDKGEWIRRAYHTMRGRRRIVGAIWFNMSKEADWRVNSSGSALDAYRDVVADPNVRHAFGM